jgi:hypothetical protein
MRSSSSGDGLFLSGDRGHELLDIYHQGDYTKVRGSEMRAIELLAARPTSTPV